MTICEGETYKLEVENNAYQLYWLLKGSYYLMYRFEMSTDTGLPRIVDRKRHWKCARTCMMHQELFLSEISMLRYHSRPHTPDLTSDILLIFILWKFSPEDKLWRKESVEPLSSSALSRRSVACTLMLENFSRSTNNNKQSRYILILTCVYHKPNFSS